MSTHKPGNIGDRMSPAEIHLAKTLCAMRWIALLIGKHDVAKAIEQDMNYLTGAS